VATSAVVANPHESSQVRSSFTSNDWLQTKVAAARISMKHESADMQRTDKRSLGTHGQHHHQAQSHVEEQDLANGDASLLSLPATERDSIRIKPLVAMRACAESSGADAERSASSSVPVVGAAPAVRARERGAEEGTEERAEKRTVGTVESLATEGAEERAEHGAEERTGTSHSVHSESLVDTVATAARSGQPTVGTVESLAAAALRERPRVVEDAADAEEDAGEGAQEDGGSSKDSKHLDRGSSKGSEQFKGGTQGGRWLQGGGRMMLGGQPTVETVESLERKRSRGKHADAFVEALGGQRAVGTVDLGLLRRAGFFGVPDDEAELRALYWQLTLGYLPVDKAAWEVHTLDPTLNPKP
jgi:hypothetical protein